MACGCVNLRNRFRLGNEQLRNENARKDGKYEKGTERNKLFTVMSMSDIVIFRQLGNPTAKIAVSFLEVER